MLTQPDQFGPVRGDESAVRLDVETAALLIDGLGISDPEVLGEAARWTTGERGPVVEDPGVLSAADLAPFVREAISIGARVISIASQSSETLAVTQAVRAASDSVDAAVHRAAASMGATTREVHEALTAQVTALVGGENPELMERLRPMLERVGTDMERQVAEGVLRANETLREDTEKRHRELTELVTDIRREVAVKVSSIETAASVVSSTTLKGFAYEDLLHPVCADIASAMGDEYEATGEYAGRLSRNKKGDGVFHLSGGVARVVMEAHDGSRKDWMEYLPEAERNRGAAASIGLVRRVEDNGGRTLRVIAPKRVILAFDPALDDVEMLRTVVLLMRTVALTGSGRFGAAEVVEATHAVREALAAIEGLDDARRSASAITGHVTKIEQSIVKTVTSIQRDLNAALNSLTGAAPDRYSDTAPAGD